MSFSFFGTFCGNFFLKGRLHVEIKQLFVLCRHAVRSTQRMAVAVWQT